MCSGEWVGLIVCGLLRLLSKIILNSSYTLVNYLILLVYNTYLTTGNKILCKIKLKSQFRKYFCYIENIVDG